MPQPLELDKGIRYEFDSDATYTADSGKEFHYISIKKISEYKDKSGNVKEKFQNLTIRQGDWAEFSDWMREVLDEMSAGATLKDDVPF